MAAPQNRLDVPSALTLVRSRSRSHTQPALGSHIHRFACILAKMLSVE